MKVILKNNGFFVLSPQLLSEAFALKYIFGKHIVEVDRHGYCKISNIPLLIDLSILDEGFLPS